MRRRAAVVPALAVLALLAGCAQEPVPAFTPPPIPEYAPPAVTAERAQEILDDVERVVAEADTTANADALAPRVTGPAVDIRRAEYALQAATNGATVPQALWTDSDITVITATDSWPRSVLAVSDVSETSPIRFYLGLVQEGPREPYKMVAWSRLLPGVTTPTFASSDIGSAPITVDQTGLEVTPTDALAQLADALTNPQSQYAGEFGSDPFREKLAAELAQLRTDVAPDGTPVGTADMASTPGSVVFGIGTADGGALIMGTIDTTTTLRKTVPEGTLTIGTEMAALGGSDPVSAAVVATYKQMVTVYIPPAGSSAQLQMLGAERVLASVQRVD